MFRVLLYVYIASLTLGVGAGISKDPFSNKEDAVGYIVLDNHGIQEKYIVIEGKEGGVKLIRTHYEPEEILKQGGQKK